MSLSDPSCAALGIPVHLHTLDREERPQFERSERLYRRHKLDDRKIKTSITFRQMSVNRSTLSSPRDALINTRAGGLHQNCGVVSFSVDALRQAKTRYPVTAEGQEYSADVRHDIAGEPCNYSHCTIDGQRDGVVCGEEMPKTVRKLLRMQLWRAVVTEIPAERAGEHLEEGSWS